jgi:hypothetical protein
MIITGKYLLHLSRVETSLGGYTLDAATCA